VVGVRTTSAKRPARSFFQVSEHLGARLDRPGHSARLAIDVELDELAPDRGQPVDEREIILDRALTTIAVAKRGRASTMVRPPPVLALNVTAKGFGASVDVPRISFWNSSQPGTSGTLITKLMSTSGIATCA
jgi:hypothetical protein